MGKSTITGIDIGHHSIKAVVLKPAKGTYVLSDYLELPAEAGIFTDNHALNYQKIVKKLKELRKALPLFSHQVALSIPDNAVISKVLQIDSDLDDREKEYAITHAFSLLSPFPPQELSLDYSDLNDVEPGSGMQNVQVYATRKELVENRVTTFRKAGFRPLLLDVHGHSLIKVWQLATLIQQKSDWVLLNIGFSQSTLCIDFPHIPPYCKSIHIGMQSIMQEKSNAQSLEIGEPRPHYHAHKLSQSDNASVSILVEKLQRHIQVLHSTHAISVQGIWLTGDGDMSPELRAELVNHLAIECELLEPFGLIKAANASQLSSPSNSYIFTAALGLALRGVDWMGGI